MYVGEVMARNYLSSPLICEIMGPIAAVSFQIFMLGLVP
jgi:hypothetical protein